MKIVFDAQLLFEKHKTGIGWNTKRLMDEMIKDHRYEYQLNIFNFRRSEEKESLIKEYRRKGCKVNECRWFPALVYNHLERLIPLPYHWLFGSQGEITQFFNFTLPFGVRGKRLTFVYDMAYRAHPEAAALKTRRWLENNLEKYCRRADRIITVSNFSKSEIVKYLSVPDDKIHVVYSGVDLETYHAPDSPAQIQAVKHKYKISGEYILYMGTLEPRKNIEGLLNAYHQLKKEDKTVPCLVIAGKKGWLYESIFETVKDYKLQADVIFPGYIDETDAPVLMGGALMFVFPSLYEGFGMPPLEAMACGTPVITTNGASLPEVVGDAGLLVAPGDVTELKTSMQRLLKEPQLREELSKKGLLRAKQFTWDASAKKLLDIYAEMKTETANAND